MMGELCLQLTQHPLVLQVQLRRRSVECWKSPSDGQHRHKRGILEPRFSTTLLEDREAEPG